MVKLCPNVMRMLLTKVVANKLSETETVDVSVLNVLVEFDVVNSRFDRETAAVAGSSYIPQDDQRRVQLVSDIAGLAVP